jgi:hypothetical protein
MLTRLFTEHPESVGETYFEHVGVALSFSLKMFFGAMVCLVHAVLPFLFVKTGSEVITELHDRMVENRNLKVDKASELLS